MKYKKQEDGAHLLVFSKKEERELARNIVLVPILELFFGKRKVNSGDFNIKVVKNFPDGFKQAGGN
jgi:hypothetical protein